MVFKNFRFQVIFRILLLVATIILIDYLIQNTGFWVSVSILILLSIFQLVSLIFFVEKTNRKLTQFLESIRHSDFTSTFSAVGKGRSFKDLSKAFNEVIEAFNKTRSAEAEHLNYLQTVVQHVKIGIMAFRKDGKVDMINNSIKRIFKVNNLKNIHDLSDINDELPSSLLKMESGDSLLFKLLIDNEIQQLSIYSTEFRMRGEEYLLVSIQNIYSELEEKEIEAWQKLIRVLTHEIMNSITPISSLASTVQDLLIDENGHPVNSDELDEDTIESVKEALTTIEKRSKGLLNFVDIYRNLTRIPKPNFRYFLVSDIFGRAEHLLKPTISENKIDCSMKVIPEDLKLTADPDLIEQVLINLVLNAIDAVKGMQNPKIKITASINVQNKIRIEVWDNGYGIKPDLLEKIFIPFFTSKKEGSGIGLSLSRQIMHMHKGKITVKSSSEEGTVFNLIF
jgi:two-component system nitrogen regulation sensor histidine kinase NtrY